MSNHDEVAKAFVQHYYTCFDSDRSQLGNLYQPQSMLSFEGEQFMGPPSIVDKLVKLPFQTVRHEVVSIDAQPSLNNGVLVFVSGSLRVDQEQNPLKFSQVFHLQPLPTGQGYFVYNDLFRLNIG